MDRSSEDPSCCGMRLYSGFGTYEIVGGKIAYYSHERRVAKIKGKMATTCGGYATLTEVQVTQGWGKALTECGWIDAGNFINPNSTNKVHIWVYTPPVKKKKSLLGL